MSAAGATIRAPAAALAACSGAPAPGLLLGGLLAAAAACCPPSICVITSAATGAARRGRGRPAHARVDPALASALAAAVTATAIALALPLAWLTTRTDLPGRRLWATLVTLPLVVPSYIGAYLLVSASGPRGFLQDALGVEQIPSIYGFPGAWLALTLFTYPLVLLPVRSALRRLDPQLEDAARAMGRSPGEAFRSVVMPQLVPAIGAGALLVALYVMSDFGAVSIMRFDSFTREIYISYNSGFDRTPPAALGAVLVAR